MTEGDVPRNDRGCAIATFFIVIASEAWQSPRGVGLLRHVVPRNDRGGAIAPFFIVILSPLYCHCERSVAISAGMGLLRHVVPRNDRGGAIATFFIVIASEAWQSRWGVGGA